MDGVRARDEEAGQKGAEREREAHRLRQRGRPEDSKILDVNIDWLQSNSNYVILIEGHCDERGTNEYNVALGEHRAIATMNYLMSRGVQKDRITTFSYGEERPFCTERTEACWALNRRAHFLVKLAKAPR